MQNLEDYTLTVAKQSRAAARQLAVVTTDRKIAWLHAVAKRLRTETPAILSANEEDLAKAPEFGLNEAAVDRLRLDNERLESIASAVEKIAELPDPIGEVIETTVRPNGLEISRVRVPLGVVFFIYESRPNVTIDAAALCIMSGNTVVLRGGKEAFHSNTAFHKVLVDALKECDLPEHAAQLVETTDRTAVGHFLKLGNYIDVTIPRGGRSLIERVTSEATMPVIKHFDGICHIYVDKAADLTMAEQIVVNAKCQRPGVCNALETLLVHRDVAEAFLPKVGNALVDQLVELRGAKPATEDDYRTEYLDLILSVRTVDSIDEAIDHITDYGSGHTESIITTDPETAEYFTARVDSSAVMVNASTRFNDGGEFGLGAEIGISTDRFHARGPCGLKEITTYKYVVRGDGQIRI
ncbi:UNVERIFIED_CONTAM: hypothetical protein GTU68_034532 [Idotea baltica]|nr:hypothetical protein [Idotea baltica]